MIFKILEQRWSRCNLRYVINKIYNDIQDTHDIEYSRTKSKVMLN